MELIRKFDLNQVGRDYVVGDIHGQFTKLGKQLDATGFDPKYDRLFSVGDLVDRGPESYLAKDWLKEPWFFAVQGNHEHMIIESMTDMTQKYLSSINGGEWFASLSLEKKLEHVAAFKAMPLRMEVDTYSGVVGIVHAECEDDWLAPVHPDKAMWCRERIQYNIATPVSNIHTVYVGHTPTQAMCTLGNVVYLDNGAWAKRNEAMPFRIVQLD
jgi:serine/threonine protein phosphatase 1